MPTHESRSESGRVRAVEIANGDVVIYDVEDSGAWIQSDDTVPTDGMN